MIANFVGQGYVLGASIVMLPLYLHEMGAEAYGLVGLFVVVQAWLRILDMGFSPTLARQVSHARGAKESETLNLRSLVRTIECLFLGVGIVASLCIWNASHWIASNWLNVQSLQLLDVAYCLTLMGIAASLRWFASLYRGGIQGMERQVWINIVNILVATLRYVGAWVLLKWISNSPSVFFEYQLVVALLEMMILARGFYRFLPAEKKGRTSFSWRVLEPVLPFTGGVAYATIVWVLLTQLDKLVLSNVLSLSEYGYFALVAVIAGGILSVSAPVSEALLPRLTLLFSQGRNDSMLSLYRDATQFLAIIILPLATIVALFSEELIFSWTGDRDAANWAGPVLRWFSLGNGLLALGAFQYYLQYAHGKIKLHAINSTINVVVQTPIILYAAYFHGAIGVAVAWFIIRLLSFFIWPAIVHKKFAPGIHGDWLFKDVMPVVVTTGAVMLFVFLIGLDSKLLGSDRLTNVFFLFALGLCTVSVNLLSSRIGRPYLSRIVNVVRAVS